MLKRFRSEITKALGYLLVLTVGVGIGLLLGLLPHGSHSHAGPSLWHKITTTPVGKKTLFEIIAGPVIQVIGGGIAGLIALWQFNRTYVQRELHHRKTREQDQQRLDDAKQQFQDNQRQLDEQFRNRQLADQFGDIQNRLAQAEPMIRANAALRLAQFGTTVSPNAIPGDKRRNETNNPYFVPAASQLATALYLEPKPEIREAVREAIRNLINFGSQVLVSFTIGVGQYDQPLLHALIKRLGDANRSAKDNFIRALARYTIYGADNQLNLNFIASLAPFCSDVELTKACLEALMAERERKDYKVGIAKVSAYNVQVRTFQETRLRQQNDEIDKRVASAIPALLTAARQAIDTRDSLVEALLRLSTPVNFPKEDDGFPDREPLTPWLRSPDLNLSKCLLAGAFLIGAQLQGADLSEAHLHGAYLEGAKLQKGSLDSAQLQGAELGAARLHNADLSNAQLQGADLSRARLQGTNLSDANLEKAHLYGVYVQRKGTVGALATVLPEDTLAVAFFNPYGLYGYPDAEADARTKELKEWLTPTLPAEEKKPTKRRKKAE